MLGQFSLGSLGLVVGSILSVVGFTAYFMDYPTFNLVGFFYGIPLLLGGLALKAAELPPVSLKSSPEALSLRDQQATSTQTQIRKDVTRYRYGQKAHLDSSLDYLELGVIEAEHPVLIGLREEVIDGSYALILAFDSFVVPFATWQQKQEKIERFFGPGLRVELSQPQDDLVDVALIATPNQVSAPNAA